MTKGERVSEQLDEWMNRGLVFYNDRRNFIKLNFMRYFGLRPQNDGNFNGITTQTSFVRNDMNNFLCASTDNSYTSIHPYLYSSKKRAAFTLAEVLITLGIIGVVAAITMPVLIQNYKKHEYVTRLKKAYTALNNGFQQIIINEGCEGNDNTLECTGMWGTDFETEFKDEDNKTRFKNAIKKAFNTTYTEYCTEESTSTICTNPRNYLKGSVTTNNWRGRFAWQTADGYYFYIGRTKCYAAAYDASPKFKKDCGYIMVDTNGSKSPNQGGRDNFEFILSQNGYLIPVLGTDYALASCNSINSGCYWKKNRENCGIADKPLSEYSGNILGHNCAARIIENGWKMDY